jgi:hypothetical protein
VADENGWCSVGVPIPIRVDCIWIGRNVEVAEAGQLVASVTVAIGWLCFALLYGLVTRAIHGGVSLWSVEKGLGN